MNINALLTKATTGHLSEQEKRFAADIATSQGSDAYTAVVVLGRSFAKEYRAVVESLLDSPSDPMLARGAVYALCQCWDDTERYLSEINAFCGKVDWDVDDDVRLIAITCAGEFLRNNWNEELAGSLLNIVDKEEDDIVRNAARTAIARAMGIDHGNIPSPRRLLEGTSSLSEESIENFRKRVSARYP